MIKRIGIMVILLVFISPAFADYTVQGVFQYEDRPQNQNGFTGEIVNKPIRGADIEVVDISQSPVVVLARGSTDATGYFSVLVIDSSVRTIAVRALTSSEQNTELFRQTVVAYTNYAIYSVVSPSYENHQPDTDIDFTSAPVIADKDGAGPAFHVFDLAETAENYVQDLTSALPRNQMKVYWEKGKDNGKFTEDECKGVHLNGGDDDDSYDDSVILHEMGHYIALCYSKDAKYYTGHGLGDILDIRMSYTEGLGSYFMGAIRNYAGDPNAMLYIETNGQQLRWYGMAKSGDRDSPSSYYSGGFTQSAANEVVVAHALYDIVDGKSTNDGTPGVDDDGIDLPGMEGDRLVWNVLTGIDQNFDSFTKKVSLEVFWDLWPGMNSYASELSDVFRQLGIKYFADSRESDNSYSSAHYVDLSSQNEIEHTYYQAGDEDWISFDGSPDYYYVFETAGLYDGADTMLSLYDTDGTTLMETNNDATKDARASRIAFNPQVEGRYFLQSKRFRESPIPIGEYGYFILKAKSIAKPRVDSVLPSEGDVRGGTSIVISGANFAQGAKVFFGVYEASAVSVTGGGTITAVTPANVPGLSAIKVVNSENSGVSPQSDPAGLFTFTGDALPPAMNAFSPDSGSNKAGTEVAINGDYFINGAQVFFGDMPAETIVESPKLIRSKVPDNEARSSNIKVVNPDGKQSVSESTFETTTWYSDSVPLSISNRKITKTITVDEDFTLTDMYVALDVGNMPHQSYLTAALTSPSGKSVLVYDGAIVVDSETGDWRTGIISKFGYDEPPAEMLRSFEGENAKGTWTLTINDPYGYNPSLVLNSWGIELFRFRKTRFSSILLAAAQYRNYALAVDPVSKKKLYRVKMEAYPHDVAINTNDLTVYGITYHGRIAKFDLLTGKKIDTFNLGESVWGTHVMEVSPDGRLLAVATSESAHLIDTATKTDTKVLEAEMSGPASLAISPDSTKAYVVGGIYGGDTGLWVIDLGSNSVVKRIDVPDGSQSVAFSPDGSKAYVLDWGSNIITVINVLAGEIEDAFPAKDGGSVIKIAKDARKAYYTRHQWYGDFGVADLVTKESLIVEFSDNPEMTTTGLSVAEDTGLVYVADWYHGLIEVVDPSTDARAGKIILNDKDTDMPPYTIYPMGIDYSVIPNPALIVNSILEGYVQQDISFFVTSFYAGDSNLVYFVENLPEGASFDANIQKFTWTPAKNQSGNYTVIFTVTDGSFFDSKSVLIKIENVNLNLLPIGDKITSIGSNMEFPILATYDGINFLQYTAENLPEGAHFDQYLQKLTWSPDHDQAGAYNVTFKVSTVLIKAINDASVAAYFNLDDTLDNSDFINHTFINVNCNQKGKIGNSCLFDGVRSYVNTLHSDGLNPSSITIEAWVNPESYKYGNMVSKNSNSGYRFRLNPDGTISWFDRGGINYITTGTQIPLDKWTHIAVTGDSEGLQIYINGVLSGYNNMAYGAGATSGDLAIGAEPQFREEYFKGKIDDVRIWRRVLSDDEIMASYGKNMIFKNTETSDYIYNDSTTVIIYVKGETVISLITPSSSKPNMPIILTGTDFTTSGNDITFCTSDGDASICMSAVNQTSNSTHITTIVPQLSEGLYNVYVSNINGKSNSLPFTVLPVKKTYTVSFISVAAKDGMATSSSATTLNDFSNMGSTPQGVRRAFLYFDTSSIPSTAVIKSAKLTVKGYNFAKAKCVTTGNVNLRVCNFDPLDKSDFSACLKNAKNTAYINLPETGGAQKVSIVIDPVLVSKQGSKSSATQFVLISQNEACKTGELGNFARICSDIKSTTSWLACQTDADKPVLEVTYEA